MPDHETLSAFPASQLPHVGTYRRVLPISLERMYENTLDWEHLPWVHADSFSSIRCEDAGPWGWRARVADPKGRESLLELRLDRACRRWITRNLEGPNAGAEIWTHAFPIDRSRVDIVVDFFVPGVAPEARDKIGAAYAGLYAKLYDEDVAMMVERQRQLDRRVGASPDDPRELDLGERAALELPLRFELAGREWVLKEAEGSLVAHAALCPHQLGPLAAAPLDGTIVTCPWHGYQFDVTSGTCVSGQRCRLPDAPEVHVDSGRVRVRVTS